VCVSIRCFCCCRCNILSLNFFPLFFSCLFPRLQRRRFFYSEKCRPHLRWLASCVQHSHNHGGMCKSCPSSIHFFFLISSLCPGSLEFKQLATLLTVQSNSSASLHLEAVMAFASLTVLKPADRVKSLQLEILSFSYQTVISASRVPMLNQVIVKERNSLAYCMIKCIEDKKLLPSI